MANVNDPSVQQDYSWLYQNQQPMPAALPEEEENKFEEKNPNLWKPECTAKVPESAAVVRILPQGIEGARAGLRPEVHVLSHRLVLRNGKFWKNVKCRKMEPGPDGKASRCPICDTIWDRYNAIKNSQGDAAAKASKLTKMLPVENVYANVLVRQDELHSENSNHVKIWDATPHQWELSEKPLPDEYKSPSRNKKRTFTQDNGTQNTKKIARKADNRKFFPSNPITGVDFVIVASWDPTKQIDGRQGMANYDESYYADMATPVAGVQQQMQDGSIGFVPNNEAICQILDQCFDLSEFRKGIPTEQAATAIANEFWAAYDGSTQAEQNGAQANTYQGQMAMAQQTQQAYAPQNQQAYMPQNQIPNVPPTAKISTGNAAAFMAPQGAPTQNYMRQQPSPQQPMPQNPAFNPQPAVAQPAQMPQSAYVQQTFARPAAQPTYAQPAPQQPVYAQPAQPTYNPPAAPQQQAMPQNPAFNPQPAAAPQQSPFNQTSADDDEDLPF